jgi:hypothetical protein
MAAVTVDLERRQERRHSGSSARWQSHAVLRPGVHVTIINITSRAALVESAARLRPGAITELQLCGTGGRACIKGRLDRCRVTALDPLRYQGVVMFDAHLDIEE